MKTYKIYLKKNKKGVFEDVVLITEGFILWALLFNLFWLIHKKMWKYVLFVLSFFVLLDVLKTYDIIYPYVVFPIQFGAVLLIGFEGGNWYEKTLQKKGYELLGHSIGRNKQEARLRFLDQMHKNKGQSLKVKIF